MSVPCEVKQISFGMVLPHAFPHHEAEPGGFLLLFVTQLFE